MPLVDVHAGKPALREPDPAPRNDDACEEPLAAFLGDQRARRPGCRDGDGIDAGPRREKEGRPPAGRTRKTRSTRRPARRMRYRPPGRIPATHRRRGGPVVAEDIGRAYCGTDVHVVAIDIELWRPGSEAAASSMGIRAAVRRLGSSVVHAALAWRRRCLPGRRPLAAAGPGRGGSEGGLGDAGRKHVVAVGRETGEDDCGTHPTPCRAT